MGFLCYGLLPLGTAVNGELASAAKRDGVRCMVARAGACCSIVQLGAVDAALREAVSDHISGVFPAQSLDLTGLEQIPEPQDMG